MPDRYYCKRNGGKMRILESLSKLFKKVRRNCIKNQKVLKKIAICLDFNGGILYNKVDVYNTNLICKRGKK